MSDDDRDQIDDQVVKFMKSCNDVIKSLKGQGKIFNKFQNHFYQFIYLVS